MGTKRSYSCVTADSQNNQRCRDIFYPKKLEKIGVYMHEYKGQLPEEAKKFNNELLQELEKPRLMPQDTLFSDDYFEGTMKMIKRRTESVLIQTILHLMFPHIPELIIRGKKDYEHFVQCYNECWNGCTRYVQTRPQPYSAIGFGQNALTPVQLEKLLPYIGSLYDKSEFKATLCMYFPFLTLEVNRGNTLPNVADNQNAHCAGIAVHGMGALFLITGQEKDLHGRISTISIAFDDHWVRIYGYYPIFEGQEIYTYRKQLASFGYGTGTCKARWKCLQYALNTVDFLGNSLRRRMHSAIDSWNPSPDPTAFGGSEIPLSELELTYRFYNQNLADKKPDSDKAKSINMKSLPSRSASIYEASYDLAEG